MGDTAPYDQGQPQGSSAQDLPYRSGGSWDQQNRSPPRQGGGDSSSPSKIWRRSPHSSSSYSGGGGSAYDLPLVERGSSFESQEDRGGLAIPPLPQRPAADRGGGPYNLPPSRGGEWGDYHGPPSDNRGPPPPPQPQPQYDPQQSQYWGSQGPPPPQPGYRDGPPPGYPPNMGGGDPYAPQGYGNYPPPSYPGAPPPPRHHPYPHGHGGGPPGPHMRGPPPPQPPPNVSEGPYSYVQQPRLVEKTVLRKKFSWKHYPELERFLIANRDEYLRHSALNYTAQQKQYNNSLTDCLISEAERHNYEFDREDFNFVAIRDRIRCYYKSYIQTARKRGLPIKGVRAPKTSKKDSTTTAEADTSGDNNAAAAGGESLSSSGDKNEEPGKKTQEAGTEENVETAKNEATKEPEREVVEPEDSSEPVSKKQRTDEKEE